MTYQFLIWIIAGILVTIGFFSLIVILKSESKQNQAGKVGKAVLKLIVVLLFINVICQQPSNYSLSYSQSEWEELKVPQIDSTLYLSQLSGRNITYYSYRKDSIIHSSKRIEFDLSSTYKIIDDFDNKKEGLRLELIFIKKSLIRKEKRLNILLKQENYKYIEIDTISETQKDSILKAWGFDNKLYKRNKKIL